MKTLWFAPMFLLLLAGCGTTNRQPLATDATPTTSATDTTSNFLSSFQGFPTDIEGCSCYFSRDSVSLSKQDFVYTAKFEKLAYVKVGNELVRFTNLKVVGIDSTAQSCIASGGGYTLHAELKNGRMIGEELWRSTGTITVTDSTGRRYTASLYGECGC